MPTSPIAQDGDGILPNFCPYCPNSTCPQAPKTSISLAMMEEPIVGHCPKNDQPKGAANA
jgi:hypothetical protein